MADGGFLRPPTVDCRGLHFDGELLSLLRGLASAGVTDGELVLGSTSRVVDSEENLEWRIGRARPRTDGESDHEELGMKPALGDVSGENVISHSRAVLVSGGRDGRITEHLTPCRISTPEPSPEKRVSHRQRGPESSNRARARNLAWDGRLHRSKPRIDRIYPSGSS